MTGDRTNIMRHDTALIHPGACIGEGTRVWAFTNIQDRARIGAHCNICDGCFIEEGVEIGNYVTLKNHVSVFRGITLEDDVFCGANTAFINDRYPRSHRRDPWTLEKTRVKKGATIGCNAVILCGLTVGEYAFIGAGSVVTHDVAPHTIVCGNPAVIRGYACECGRKLNIQMECGCGLRFERRDDGALRKKDSKNGQDPGMPYCV